MSLDCELALQRATMLLADLEGEIRADIIGCCDGRERHCESFGCSTIGGIADRLQRIRREAQKALEDA